jgi:hypothetical protein
MSGRRCQLIMQMFVSPAVVLHSVVLHSVVPCTADVKLSHVQYGSRNTADYVRLILQLTVSNFIYNRPAARRS